jgi:hypothetical protein
VKKQQVEHRKKYTSRLKKTVANTLTASEWFRKYPPISCLKSLPKDKNIEIYSCYGYETSDVTLGWRNVDWRCLRTECQGEYLDLKVKNLTGGWRKWHVEELHNLYSVTVIRVNTRCEDVDWICLVQDMVLEGGGGYYDQGNEIFCSIKTELLDQQSDCHLFHGVRYGECLNRSWTSVCSLFASTQL